MTKKIRERMNGAEDGFTLIELLVVVIIIGILAAIAIPTFLNQRERGWQAEMTSGLRNIALEVEAAATAAGGNYTGLEGNLDTYAEGVFGTGESATSTDVNVTAGTFAATSFCLNADHDLIATGTQIYDSAAGGLGDFDPTGAAACA